MLFWLSVVLFITSSVYTVISGNPRSHAEYLVDSVNPVPKQVPRNCRNSKWSSLTWHLAHSASAFVTNQLIWISLNQGANSTWWGRTRKVWGRTRHKIGANAVQFLSSWKVTRNDTNCKHFYILQRQIFFKWKLIQITYCNNAKSFK